MDFVANIRARSVYDFNSVDINPDDQLLVLSTCTATSNAKFKDGRCVVVARRVRNGETVAVRPSDIVKNEDVIMPYAWYVNQKKTPHRYYTDSDYTIPGATYTTRRPTYFPTTPTTYRPTTSDGTRPGGPTAPPGGTTTAGGTTAPPGGTTTADGTTAPPGGTTTAGGTTAPPGGTTTAGGTTAPPGGTTTAGETEPAGPSDQTTTTSDTELEETESTGA
jgi:hypothetical protein